MLPFQGSYALTTSISDRFSRISCERVCCSFGGSGAGIPYCRCANRLHFGRTGTQEKTAGREPGKDRYGMRGVGLVREEIRRSQWSGGHSAGGVLYAALVQSDNIAAYTLAYHVGSRLGAVEAGAKLTPADMFVAQMNALAKQLKMERTRFVNPHGIDWKVKPLPYSTAEDMARLTRYAIQQLNYVLRNTNELLGRNGIDGVKTGRSARAGDCLILYANRESEVVRDGQMETVYPRHLMVVLLGSSNRFGEGAALMQRGWQIYDQWAAAGRTADPKKFL